MKFKRYLHYGIFLLMAIAFRGCLCDEEDQITGADGFTDVYLEYPLGYATLYTDYVTLRWKCEGATGSIASIIYFDTLYFTTRPRDAIVDTVHDSMWYRLEGLEPGRTYFWQVEGRADNGTRTSTVSRFFTGDVFWPARTVWHPTPDSAAVGTGINPELMWQCYNPGMEPVTYDVHFGKSSDPELVSSHQSDTTFTPGPLALDQTYYWKVISYDTANKSVEGPLWFFTTTDIAPGTPYAPRPSQDSTNVQIEGQLFWYVHNPSGEEFYYDVYLDTLPDPVKLEDSLGHRYTDYGPLQYARTYYWKVVVFRSPTDSVVGPVWNFQTIVPTYGVYAKIMFDSRLMEGIFATEEIRVRFDSSYAPDGPIDTLAADSVKVNGNLMDYSSYGGIYYYAEDPSLRWLVNGGTYLFNVFGNSEVPAANCQTEFLECSPRITAPISLATVSTDGFSVTWEDYCAGSVLLTFVQSGDTTDVSVRVNNDGAYDLTADDLAPLVGHPGYYDLTIINEVTDSLIASGYDSRSVMIKRSNHSVSVYVE